MNSVVTARGHLSAMQFSPTISLNYTFLLSEKCKIEMRRQSLTILPAYGKLQLCLSFYIRFFVGVLVHEFCILFSVGHAEIT